MSLSMCGSDVDFYALTGHKLYGPTGIGALYGKRAHLKAMRPSMAAAR
jgi:cysteine desulfurase/selenocysteine lyase